MSRHTWDGQLPFRTELRLARAYQRRAELDAKLDEQERRLAVRLRLIEAFARLNRYRQRLETAP